MRIRKKCVKNSVICAIQKYGEGDPPTWFDQKGWVKQSFFCLADAFFGARVTALVDNFALLMHFLVLLSRHL